ncbi:MAG: hypothetical protein V1661_00785 [bacterium]
MDKEKEQISEMDATKLWLSSLLMRSDLLDELLDKLNKSIDTYKIILEDKKIASFRFLVVLAVLDCYKLQVLFPTRSVVIFSNLENLLKNKFNFDDDAQEAVLQVFDIYFDMLRFSQLQFKQNPQYSPLEELSEGLLKDWVGKNIKKYYVPNTRSASPLVCSFLSLYLEYYSKFWDLFSKRYEFIKD